MGEKICVGWSGGVMEVFLGRRLCHGRADERMERFTLLLTHCV